MNSSQTLFTCMGILLFPLAIAGIALPLLPGTPVLILAAYCFAKGSPALESWLLDHPRFGPPIQAWRTHGAIAWTAKMAASGAMGVSFVWMLASEVPLAGKLAAGIVMLGAAGFIWTRPDV